MDHDALKPDAPESRSGRCLPPTAILLGVFAILAAFPFLVREDVLPLTSVVELEPNTSDPDLLAKTILVLQRRLDNEGIPGRVELAGSRIKVYVNEANVQRAKPFLLERRVLQFLLVYETTEVEATLVEMMTEPDREKRAYLMGRDPQTGETVLLKRRGGIAPEQFEEFYPAEDAQGTPCIGFKMTLLGGKALYELTSSNIGGKLAMVLDGKVLSLPTIRSPIRTRGIIQSGGDGWSQDERSALISSLRSGALPVDVTFVSERVVHGD